MEKSMKLETFLAIAQERNENTTDAAKFNIIESRDKDSGELESVELTKETTFYCTDLIALAEALELSCYITLTTHEGHITIRVY